MNQRYNPDIHHRRSIRLRNYDYAQEGLYFVTICVQNRECLFGEIRGGDGGECRGKARLAPTHPIPTLAPTCPTPTMVLNEIGRIAHDEWLKTAELRKNVRLHNFVVMPNHFHAIVEIVHCENATGNYIVPVDNDAHTITVPAPPIRARRALPLHAPPQQNAPSQQPAPPQHEINRTNELPQTRFQNQGKNTLSAIVGSFKSAVTKNLHERELHFAWQRGFYEHVIRDYNEYARIDEYIGNNPARWNTDCFYKSDI
jgi:REP element-mobilizing transposase RayT